MFGLLPSCLGGHLFIQCHDLRIQKGGITSSIQPVNGFRHIPHNKFWGRKSKVPGPNYLWHVDGDYKLRIYLLVVIQKFITDVVWWLYSLRRELQLGASIHADAQTCTVLLTTTGYALPAGPCKQYLPSCGSFVHKACVWGDGGQSAY